MWKTGKTSSVDWSIEMPSAKASSRKMPTSRLEALWSVSAIQETMVPDNIGPDQIDWVVINITATEVWKTRLAPSSTKVFGESTVSGKIDWMISQEIFDQCIGDQDELSSRGRAQDIELRMTSCWS
jgi:hypothetical protein